MPESKSSLPRRTSILVSAVAFTYALAVLIGLPGVMAAGDSLYHFGVARQIAHGHFAPSPAELFPWTVFARLPVDHYWGFHVLVAPFALFGDGEGAMKVAAAAFFAAFLAFMHRVLARHRVPFAWAWTFASVLFSTQDWRYLQLRGGVVMALALLFFLEVAAFEQNTRRRRLTLVLAAALAMMSYNGAFILVPFHLAALAGLAVARTRGDLRVRLVEPVFSAAGLLLGLVLNPYASRDFAPLRFAFFHTWHMGTDSAGLFVGRDNVEFNPFPVHLLAVESGWIVLAIALLAAWGGLAFAVARRRPLPVAAFVYGAATLLGVVLTLRAVRMREYAVPLAFMFLAILTREALEVVSRRRWLHIVLAILFVPVVSLQARQSRATIAATSQPIGLYAGARPILEREGGVVANLVQGDATFLFWEAPSVQVASGLSPYFLYFDNHGLYDAPRTLRDTKNDVDTARALDLLSERGVRLIAARHWVPRLCGGP